MSLNPVEDWIAHARDADIDGMSGLYHDDATVEAFHETVHGQAEIAERLQALRAKLRKLHWQDVQLQASDDGAICFDTRVGGFLGLVHLRHELRINDGRIVAHRVHLVHWDKTAAS